MDSPQRKKISKTVLGFMQDPEKVHLLRTMLLSPETTKEEQEPKAETTIHKVGAFWVSTPVWGAIGVLIGAVASQVSLKFLFLGVWGVLWFHEAKKTKRIGLFRKDAKRLIYTKTYGPQESSFMTAYGPELSQTMKDKLEGLQAEQALLVHAEFGWEDHASKQIHEFCVWLQPGYLGVIGQSEVWHSCFAHNAMRH
jgi:hypothetical protein